MRGKVRHMPLPFLQDRITPAYAGKSFHGFLRRSGGKDHPRLCGEKDFAAVQKRVNQGSPPPMRGKAASKIDINFFFRIPPAYAGKSVSIRPPQKQA